MRPWIVRNGGAHRAKQREGGRASEIPQRRPALVKPWMFSGSRRLGKAEANGGKICLPNDSEDWIASVHCLAVEFDDVAVGIDDVDLRAARDVLGTVPPTAAQEENVFKKSWAVRQVERKLRGRKQHNPRELRTRLSRGERRAICPILRSIDLLEGSF
jgi:hypothetical protein